MNETRRVSIKCNFLPSLAYAKSHIFDGPMFVKLAMLSLYFYTLVFFITAKMLYKAEAEKKMENKFQLISCDEKRKYAITEQNHDHNWNHTIIFEALVPHFMTHAHKHGNRSKFLREKLF